MPGSILGNRVMRVEDPQLLTGQARYVADFEPPGLAHIEFVRSPFAHALIKGVEVSEALAAPGVLAVYSGEDLGLGPIQGFMTLNPQAKRLPITTDKARFVGDIVAAVVAETKTQAVDAAELVVVDYDPLGAVADPVEALAPGAPQQFDEIPRNVAAGIRSPEGEDPLAGAAHVVRLKMTNQRVAVVPMEANALTAIPGDDGDGHDLTVYVSTQMPHGLHTQLAKALDLEKEKVRVIAPFVGGGFGGKAGAAAEHLLSVAAARRLERPVRWAETRSENLTCSPHGRGQVDWIELGFDADHRIVGMKGRVVSDAGAYAGFGGALAIGPTRMMAQGVYEIPRISFDVVSALTNTAPMGAFRGAGRPEASELLERIMDLAADELGADPIELRAKNLIAPDKFPYTTVMGPTYDCGDYRKVLDRAAEVAGYDQLRAEQARRRAAGDSRLLGIGVSVYVEITGAGAGEYGRVEIHPDGSATLSVGTSGHGQGHATSFAMIVSDKLGIPMDKIHFVQSDTALVPRGGGTGGSRSLQMAGSATLRASEAVLEIARRVAAEALEAAPEDVVVNEEGKMGVTGVPASALSWPELVARASSAGTPLDAFVDFAQESATFPFGAHISVVEVDADTGKVTPLRHVAVDDCGKILNPMIVTGQQHGGIAQGMAQALWEEMVYDADGNPLTATLAEYAMPSAAELPSLEASNTETPSPLNPLGAKGIGESGTIGSTPSVHNAVIDAVSHLGVRHIDMPCTPEKVWAAMTEARAGHPASPWSEPPDLWSLIPGQGEADEDALTI